MFVSETDYQLYLHELAYAPELKLQQVAQIPSPEPETEDKENHSQTACWAPDGSGVLIWYNIRDYGDDRGEFNANAWFEVRPLLQAWLMYCFPDPTDPAVGKETASAELDLHLASCLHAGCKQHRNQ